MQVWPAPTIRLTRELRLAIPLTGQAAAAPDANRWLGEPVVYSPAARLSLRLTVAGQPDPRTGYVADIREIDALLRAAALRHFQPDNLHSTAPLLAAVWRDVRGAALPARPTALHCVLAPALSWSIDEESHPMIRMTESFEFSASHRLHCPDLSADENRRIFGKCNNPRGHGHNYVIDVTVQGTIQPSNGLLMRPGELEAIVRREVLARFDHRHLNDDCPEFAGVNPTVENISRIVFDLLEKSLPEGMLAALRVYETPKTWAECGRSSG